MNLRKLPTFRKGRYLCVGSFGLVVVLISSGSYFLGTRFDSRVQKLIPIPQFPALLNHAPIPDQSEVTQSDIAGWDTLTNLDSIPQNNCPAFTTQRLSEENLKESPNLSMATFRDIPTTMNPASALWLNKISVSCNSTILIHAALPFDQQVRGSVRERKIVAIRIGWYGGAGGHEVWSSPPVTLRTEKFYQPLNNQRMIETQWPVTLKMKVGRDWTPGFYIIATENKLGQIENYAPLILRSPLGSSAVALIHSTLTWQAYNEYGGRSLYRGPGLSQNQMVEERSRVASFDRPFSGSGSLLIRRDALPLVELAESKGIILDQFADTDLSDYPALTKSYNELLFSGHPEYWTQSMFINVIASRNSGVNLAFLSGNTAYWRARVQPSPQGADRHLIVYRYATQDPVTDPHQVSVRYTDPGVNQPGALLDGGFTSGVGVSGNLLPVHIPDWLGVCPTTKLSGFSKWSEIESPRAGDLSTPANIHILFQGKFKKTSKNVVNETLNNRDGVGTTFWFQSPSGAATFNAGVNLWVCNLEASCPLSSTSPATVTALQTITGNVIDTLSHREAGIMLSKSLLLRSADDVEAYSCKSGAIK
jgi:hypothetical protein